MPTVTKFAIDLLIPEPKNDGPKAVARLRPSELGDDALHNLLRDHRFNVRAAAAAAGISPTSLYQLIESSPRLRKPADFNRAEIDASLTRSNGDVDAAALELEVSSLGLKRRLKVLDLDPRQFRRPS